MRVVTNQVTVLRAFSDTPPKKPAKQIYKEEILLWITHLSTYLSLHGFPWFNRTDSRAVKTLIFCCAVALIVTLPIVVAIELANFMKSDTTQTAIQWSTASNITYPNITVCHALYFSKERLQSYNISDALANYMTMALDPYIRAWVEFNSKRAPPGVIDTVFSKFRVDLDAVLRTNGMTLLQLFQAVAVSCEETIIFCEDHRQFYGTASYKDSLECCGTLFHEKPIFSPSGTCFTSKLGVVETTPSVISSIKVWLYVDKSKSPEYDITLKGSEAAEREGVYWTLSYKDHPARQLLSSPKKASVGSSTTVALTKSRTDRTGLPQKCIKKSKVFEERFGMDHTRLNCEMLASHFLVLNCSVGVYMGLKQVGDIAPCLPIDTLSYVEQTGFDAKRAERYGYPAEECPFDCIHTRFDMKISTGMFDQDCLDKIMNGTLEAKYAVSILFYFETFDHPKDVIYQETFLDFLSKIGGWMALTIGASAISFVEIIGFLIYLARVLFRTFAGAARAS